MVCLCTFTHTHTHLVSKLWLFFFSWRNFRPDCDGLSRIIPLLLSFGAHLGRRAYVLKFNFLNHLCVATLLFGSAIVSYPEPLRSVWRFVFRVSCPFLLASFDSAPPVTSLNGFGCNKVWAVCVLAIVGPGPDRNETVIRGIPSLLMLPTPAYYWLSPKPLHWLFYPGAALLPSSSTVICSIDFKVVQGFSNSL